MVGFNSMEAMQAHLRRKPPQGGGLSAVAFTQHVGVAPGTTTMNLGGSTGCTRAVDGVQLAAGSCPPDPLNQYMTNPPVADVLAPAAAPAAPANALTAYDPYSDIVTLKGLRGLRDTSTGPLGVSWKTLGLLAGAAVVAGVGIGYLAHKR